MVFKVVWTPYLRIVVREAMLKKIIFFALIIFYTSAKAAEMFEYNIPTRARGMGGVYSPFPSDTDAIFVNPAALSEVGKLGWEIANIQAGVNSLQNYTAYAALGTGGTSVYSALYGKSLWVGGNGRTSIVFPGFGIAAFNDVKVYGGLNKPPFPDFDIGYLNDVGFQVGAGFAINPTFSLGVNVKRIQRTGGETSLGLSTIAAATGTSIESQFANAGSGFSTDLALMAKVPGPFSPRVVAMWKDPGSLAFNMTRGTASPPRIKDNFILGAGTLMDLSGLDWRLGAEIRHINVNGIQFGKKVHMGTEVSLPLIDVRAGLSQGYQSFGAGINLWFIKVDAAYYTVETGDYPGQTPDLRTEASFSINISVDADFKMTGKDGKQRRVKQRR